MTKRKGIIMLLLVVVLGLSGAASFNYNNSPENPDKMLLTKGRNPLVDSSSNMFKAKGTCDFPLYHGDANEQGPIGQLLGFPLKEGGFSMEGYNLWDPSIIKVDDTYHLFASAWKNDGFSPQWKKSEVVRATSSNLLGPYKFQEFVLERTSGKRFDREGVHNPKITRHGDRFYLYYIGIPGFKSGVAYADDIHGPWTRSEKPVIPTNNPALLIRENGSVYCVGKARKTEKDGKVTGSRDNLLEVMTSDDIFGPYTKQTGPLETALPNGYELEDPCVWRANGLYHIVLIDWEGHASGLSKAFLHYVSEDGVKYRLVSPEPIIAHQYPIRFEDGSEVKFRRVERPNIFLNEDGAVTALMAGCLPEGDDSSVTSKIVIFPVDHYEGTVVQD